MESRINSKSPVKKGKYSYYIGILFLFEVLYISSCIEPYYPDIDAYKDMPVIEAVITDEAIAAQVFLSRSFAYDDYKSEKITGATVEIVENDVNHYSLIESSKGKYTSIAGEWTGKVGNRYQLFIWFASGEEFVSEPVVMKSTPPIDSVTYKYSETENTNEILPQQGVKFFIYTHDPKNQTRYYRWKYNETWEFTVPFQSEFKPNSTTCWKSDSSKSVIIGSTIALVSDAFNDHPLYFVDNSTNKLAIGYSTLIKQYALSEKAFQFYKTINDNNESSGSLFDIPPSQVVGNIVCKSNPDLPVFGLLTASEVKSYRIIVLRKWLPKNFYTSSGFEYCSLMEVRERDQDIIANYLRQGFVFYIRYYNSQLASWMVVLVSEGSCMDCTILGTNKKPDYWIDN